MKLHQFPIFRRTHIVFILLVILICWGVYRFSIGSQTALTIHVISAQDYSDHTHLSFSWYVEEGYVGYLLIEDEKYGMIERTPLKHVPVKFSFWHLIEGKPGPNIIQTMPIVPNSKVNWSYSQDERIHVAEGEMELIKTYQVPSNQGDFHQQKVYFSVEKAK
ncbi:MAG: hypothetical protein KDA65_04715 [Planctomycetaceae bacterium]|nr:hypothetical protein [Planctomycetaceae bacterium]